MDTITKLFCSLVCLSRCRPNVAASLDVWRTLNLITPVVADNNKALLERIVQMLTKLIKSRRPTE